MAQENKQNWPSLEGIKERWDRLCPGVDPVIEEYVRTTGSKPESWLHGTPSRALTWVDGDYNHSISMHLPSEGVDLDVWVATWQDNEDLKRRTTYTLHERFKTPVFEDPLRTSLRDLMVGLNATVENPLIVLRGGPLPRDVKEFTITVSPLR